MLASSSTLPRSLLHKLQFQMDYERADGGVGPPTDRISGLLFSLTDGAPTPVKKFGMSGMTYSSGGTRHRRAAGLRDWAQDHVAGWTTAVCCSPTGASGQFVPISWGATSTNFMIQCNVPGSGNARRMSAEIYDGASGYSDFNNLYSVNVNQEPLHLTVVRMKAQRTTIYGARGGSGSPAQKFFFHDYANTYAGSAISTTRCDVGSGIFGGWFAGDLFWSAAWSRPLSESEIAALIDNRFKGNPFQILRRAA